MRCKILTPPTMAHAAFMLQPAAADTEQETKQSKFLKTLSLLCELGTTGAGQSKDCMAMHETPRVSQSEKGL